LVLQAVLNSRKILTGQLGANHAITSDRLEVDATARGSESRRQRLVSAMKPSSNEFLAFGEELLNQQIQERILSNGRWDPGEQTEVTQ
jgi:hypothetical protein